MTGEITKCYRVYGIVQGVGFRPTVSRHAASCGIRGSVSNKGPYVEIFAQGAPDDVGRFRDLLEQAPPVRAFILNIQEIPVHEAPQFARFEIIESAMTKGAIFISPDIAVCDTCKRELYDPADRRYLHPFINCTCCGPRMTILDALPYDRERTSMKVFPMCPDCAREYVDPASRRYDAQPVCCNDCGPQVYLIPWDTDAELAGGAGSGRISGREAITVTRRVIREGGIAAIKGIGGFHLCCDATSDTAVQLLRARKKRPMKPLAVMARNMDAARAACEISDRQAEILDGHQKPIILLKRRTAGTSQGDLIADAGGRPDEAATDSISAVHSRGEISDFCAPDNPKIGLMLPYAPLHLLLFDYDDGIEMPDYLVMTSANESGAPICRDDADAISELGSLCDCMLSHDRMIRIRADDTVMDFYRGEPYMVRRSRGYAPLPVTVSVGAAAERPAASDGRQQETKEDGDCGIASAEDAQGPESSEECRATEVLAIGGELKNTFCVGVGDLFYLSPYVGDLEDVRTGQALRETAARFETLLEAHPSVTACDMHPLYHSVEAAREMGRPLYPVQHHYAHVLSCMAENDCLEPVVGISYDGTGYGTDGTIWGGEILLSDLNGFRRAAHIKPFLQIGGDAGVREGWRIAAGMIHQLYEDADEAADVIRRLELCSEQEAQAAGAMVRRGINAVVSTSAGRLFDAVSAVLGIRRISTFEGEAATALQFAAEAYGRSGRGETLPADCEAVFARIAGGNSPVAYSGENLRSAPVGAKRTSAGCPAFSDGEAGTIVLPADALFREIVRSRLDGADSGMLARQFHQALADMTVHAAVQIREETQVNAAALTGGVFQNTLLLRMCEEGLEEAGFRVLRHHLVPPNDGGIALGQAVAASYALQRKTEV